VQLWVYLPAWRWCVFGAGIAPMWYASAVVMRGLVLLVESRWLAAHQALYYIVSIRVRFGPSRSQLLRYTRSLTVSRVSNERQIKHSAGHGCAWRQRKYDLKQSVSPLAVPREPALVG